MRIKIKIYYKENNLFFPQLSIPYALKVKNT